MIELAEQNQNQLLFTLSEGKPELPQNSVRIFGMTTIEKTLIPFKTIKFNDNSALEKGK